MDINSAVGRKQGITADQLLDLHRHASSSAFNTQEKVALELTDELCNTPAHVTADLFARLQQHFTYPQIVELSATIAFENYRARFNRVFDIGSAGFSEGGVCALPEQKTSPEEAAISGKQDK